MPERNALEIVQDYNDALRRKLGGEEVDLLRFLHPQLLWRFPKSVEDNGAPSEIHTAEAMIAFLGGGIDALYRVDTMDFAWSYIPTSNEYVTARLRMRAKTNRDADYDNEYMLLYRLQDGQIREVWEMFDTAYFNKVFRN